MRVAEETMDEKVQFHNKFQFERFYKEIFTRERNNM